MENQNLAAMVLAAGLGTRMRSKQAKVLHALGGAPMIARSLRAVSSIGARPVILVVGHQASVNARLERSHRSGRGAPRAAAA